MIAYKSKFAFDKQTLILNVSSLQHRHNQTDYALIASHLNIDINLTKLNTIIIIPQYVRIHNSKHNTKQMINEFIKQIDIDLWFHLAINLRNSTFITLAQLKEQEIIINKNVIDIITNSGINTFQSSNNRVNILNNIKDFNLNYDNLTLILPKAIDTKDLIKINAEINKIKDSVNTIKSILDDTKYENNFDDLFE